MKWTATKSYSIKFCKFGQSLTEKNGDYVQYALGIFYYFDTINQHEPVFVVFFGGEG